MTPSMKPQYVNLKKSLVMILKNVIEKLMKEKTKKNELFFFDYL